MVGFASCLIQVSSGSRTGDFVTCMEETHRERKRGHVWGKSLGAVGCWPPLCCQEPLPHLKVIGRTLLNVSLSVD